MNVTISSLYPYIASKDPRIVNTIQRIEEAAHQTIDGAPWTDSNVVQKSDHVIVKVVCTFKFLVAAKS